MDAEYLLVYDSGKREIVEDIRAVLPDVQAAVFSEAFVVEAVDLSYLAGLMVPSQQGYSALVTDFQRQEEDKGFNAVQSTIYKISEEEVGDVRGIPSDFEEFQKIVELSVDVSADGDGRIDTG